MEVYGPSEFPEFALHGAEEVRCHCFKQIKIIISKMVELLNLRHLKMKRMLKMLRVNGFVCPFLTAHDGSTLPPHRSYQVIVHRYQTTCVAHTSKFLQVIASK